MNQDAQGIEIAQASKVTKALVEAFTRLVPQLSKSAAIPDPEMLAVILRSPCNTLLIARDTRNRGQILGVLTLVVFKIPTGTRALIEDVVVEKDARGRGLGEMLTREAIRLALNQGARSIDLTSSPAREAANRLYRRLGFEPRETNLYRYSVKMTKDKVG